MSNTDRIGRALAKALAKELKENNKKPKVSTKELKAKCIEWYKKKLGVKVVKQNFKVSLPTKAGDKEYEAVKFDNGRTGVFIKGNTVLKYAWA